MRRNPFNATKPAEWATMSKSLRRAWNRRHWRPEQWKCDLALKKEATRMANRRSGGAGMGDLAEKLMATNPPAFPMAPSRARKKARWHQGRYAVERERRKLAWLSPAERRRIDLEETVVMRENPYPFEHSARLRPPTAFRPDTFRRENKKGGTIGLIYGKLKRLPLRKPARGPGSRVRDAMVLQAVRFRSAHWSAQEARRWLKAHGMKPIRWEPAKHSGKAAWKGEAARLKRGRARRRTRTRRKTA